MTRAQLRLLLVVAALLVAGASASARSLSSAAADPATDEAHEVVGSRNGRPVRLRVIPVGDSEVEVQTARAFLAMRAAAARDDVELDVRSGFRDRAEQEWLYLAWRAGHGNRAARPGYSAHESGEALDLRVDERTLAWLRANAPRFGFAAPVRSEPWHWVHGDPGQRIARRPHGGGAQERDRRRPSSSARR